VGAVRNVHIEVNRRPKGDASAELVVKVALNGRKDVFVCSAKGDRERASMLVSARVLVRSNRYHLRAGRGS
jgi:hypothetical protein